MRRPDDPPAADDRRPRPLFAAFSHRFANTALEMLVLLALIGTVVQPALRAVPWVEPVVVIAALLVVYFAGFWASPLAATPFQLAGRLKVLDYRGRTLSPWRALVRASGLLLLAGGATTLAATPREPLMWAVAAPACALLFTGALTRHRQIAHDLLVRSVVVYRRALDAPGGHERLLAALAGTGVEPEPGTWRRAGALLRDALMLVVPVVLVHAVAGVQFDRDLRWRVQYALRSTGGLQAEVQAFHHAYGRLPRGPHELETGARTPYPDGGYFVLDDRSRIVIRFTVLPELTRGRLVLTPQPGEGALRWTCRDEGHIDRAHLPADCRD